MFCEPSNATFVLDRLEEQGLVERRPHPTDRRAKQIVLTPAGDRRRAEVLDHLRTQSPLGPLTESQHESLHDLLQTLDAQR
jgi:DNA-binding MarR family transcriptional regulator